jgi:hypothetical protein
MTRVYQTRGGAEGNCWPAALASILDLTLEETDHCCFSNEDAFERSQAFLAQRGLFYLEIVLDGAKVFRFSLIPDGALVIGCDASGELEHAVILRCDHGRPGQRGKDANNEMSFYVIHDPARPDGSLRPDYQITRIMFICRLLKE